VFSLTSSQGGGDVKKTGEKKEKWQRGELQKRSGISCTFRTWAGVRQKNSNPTAGEKHKKKKEKKKKN